MTNNTLIPTLAEWAIRLNWRDIPPVTQRLARLQLVGWLGSLAAGWVADEAPKGLRVAGGLGGPKSGAVWPFSSPILGAHGAATLSAMLSCAQDYDDYLFLAHTSHSACGVPWTYAQSEGRTVRRVLTAQIAANEVMGRLGASCLVGPQNGQMWTFVHLAGATIGATRLLEGSIDELDGALSTAFFQPPLALRPGFAGSSAKVMSAATPTLQGLLAVELARQGIRGATDALEGRGGFFERFSYLPLTDWFDSLGEQWVTDSVSIKPLPGCAYVTAPALATLACLEAFAEQYDRLPSPSEIERVDVQAGPMTLAMEQLMTTGGRSASAPPPLTTVALNFSVKLTVAAVLLHGRLAPEEIATRSLKAHERLLRNLAGRVRLSLDVEAGRRLIEELGFRGGIWPQMKRHGVPALARGLYRALRAHHLAGAVDRKSGRIGMRQVATLVRDIGRSWGDRDAREETGRLDVTFPFGASVELTLRDGRRFSHRIDVPAGASGSGIESIAEVARNKILREGSRWVELDELTRLADGILTGDLDDSPVSRLTEQIAQSLRNAAPFRTPRAGERD